MRQRELSHSARSTTLVSSIARVIGPTPPGTGLALAVIALAIPAT